MAGPEAALAARALRAYEWGRLRAALPAAVVAVPMIALSFAVCRQYAASSAGGAALVAVLLAAAWRGQDFGRGARAGLVAGLGPLLLPLATCFHLCAGGTCLLAPTTCVVAGAVGGVVVTSLARRGGAPGPSRRYLAASLAVAALAGSLGCVIAGLGGVLGMALGLAAGSAPVAWRPSRA
jgi:hypothetical protein